MSYDDPQTIIYRLGPSTFGATTESTQHIGPKGKRGIVRDISATPTVDLVGTTSVPEIGVGATQGANEYARFRLGTAAGVGYTVAGGPRRATQLNLGGYNRLTLSDFPEHVALEKGMIPADTPFFISRVQGSGGTPAGQAHTEVTIDWF